MLASGQVDAIAAWQPNSGQALKAVAGSTSIYSSADEPGLIYDTITVSPQSLAQNRAAWVKLVSVWDKVLAYINDPKTKADALKIMAARTGSTPEEYGAFLGGTRFLSLAESAKIIADKGSWFQNSHRLIQSIRRIQRSKWRLQRGPTRRLVHRLHHYR